MKIQHTKCLQLKAGQIITYGHYPQTKSGTDNILNAKPERMLIMIYRQKYDDLFLLDANLDFYEAFDLLSQEIAANLFLVNNMYCQRKYMSPYDLFLRFPACKEYDGKIQKLVLLANDFITARYGVIDADTKLCEHVIRRILRIRRDIQAEMKKL